MFSLNGPPKGQNTTSDQSSYDIIFKDIIINYPPPNSNVSGTSTKYSVSLPFEFDKIYKAELIVATVNFTNTVAANDNYINIPNTVRDSTMIVNIPQLKNNTVSIANQQSTTTSGSINNNSSYTSNIFCQIPDSYTSLGGANNTSSTPLIKPSNSISTYIGGPPFSAEQFYNPPLNNISLLDIYITDIYGNSLFLPQPCTQTQGTDIVQTESKINSFYFTIRFYYLTKRNNTTQFSVPLFNYAASGTVDSVFEAKRYN